MSHPSPAVQAIQDAAMQAPFMVWRSGVDTAFVYFNKAWLKFRGRPFELERGDGWVEGVHSSDLAHVSEVYRHKEGAAFQLEYRLRNSSGEYRWVLERGIPLWSPDQKFLGYFGACVDIDDIKCDRVPEPTQELHAVDARLATFMADINDLHRIEGRSPEAETFSLEEAVASTFSLVKGEASANGVTMIRGAGQTVGQVSVDQRALREALWRCLYLAISASMNKTVTMSLGIVTVGKNQGYSEVIIEDSGGACTLDECDRLFDGYAVLRGEPTGLRYYVLQRLAAQLGGSVRASSTRTGLVIGLSLPDSSISCQTKPNESLERGSILVVDDNHVNRAVLCGMLDAMGLHYVSVDRAETAIRVTSQTPFDLILMDCHMPGMDGYEATRIILEKHPDALVVAVTADQNTSNKDKCREVGMRGFLAKPYSFHDLATLLSTFLHSSIVAPADALTASSSIRLQHPDSKMISTEEVVDLMRVNSLPSAGNCGIVSARVPLSAPSLLGSAQLDEDPTREALFQRTSQASTRMRAHGSTADMGTGRLLPETSLDESGTRKGSEDLNHRRQRSTPTAGRDHKQSRGSITMDAFGTFSRTKEISSELRAGGRPTSRKVDGRRKVKRNGNLSSSTVASVRSESSLLPSEVIASMPGKVAHFSSSHLKDVAEFFEDALASLKGVLDDVDVKLQCNVARTFMNLHYQLATSNGEMLDSMLGALEEAEAAWNYKMRSDAKQCKSCGSHCHGGKFCSECGTCFKPSSLKARTTAQPSVHRNVYSTSTSESTEDVAKMRRLRTAARPARSPVIAGAAREGGVGDSVAAKEMRGRVSFFSTVNHELRNLLHGALGMADALGMTQLSSNQHKLLACLSSSVGELQQAIDTLITFVRLREGAVVLEEGRVSLLRAVETVAEEHAHAAHEKGLDVVVDLDSTGFPDEITGDNKRICEIVSQLLSNAIAKTSKGSVAVCTRVDQEGSSKPSLLVEVRDTGAGIPLELQKNFLDCFKAAAERKERVTGTGLGLPVASGLAQLMGGSLTFTSVPGEGTSFFFRLPLREPSPAEVLSGTLSLSGGLALTVFILHSNRHIRESAAFLLRRMGCYVTLASGERDAIDSFPRSEVQDVVLVASPAPLSTDGFLSWLVATGRSRSSNVFPIVPACRLHKDLKDTFKEQNWDPITGPLTPSVLHRVVFEVRNKAGVATSPSVSPRSLIAQNVARRSVPEDGDDSAAGPKSPKRPTAPPAASPEGPRRFVMLNKKKRGGDSTVRDAATAASPSGDTGSTPAVVQKDTPVPSPRDEDNRMLSQPAQMTTQPAQMVPAAGGEEVAAGSLDGVERPFSSTSIKDKAWRVLVADDREYNQQLATRMLSFLRVEAVCVNDGKSAVEKVKSESFDLIIMDVSMPVMDGYKAIALIRVHEEEQNLPRVPIVGFTAFDSAMCVERLMSAGADDILSKPTRLADIKRVLSKFIPGFLADGAVQESPQVGSRPIAPRDTPKVVVPSNKGVAVAGMTLPPPYNILIADDSSVSQEVLSWHLSSLGYSFIAAADGRQAVATVEMGLKEGATPVDLVLMDVRMPEMDGVEATRRLRILDQMHQRHTVIICMSASSLPNDLEECRAAGADDFLDKPISREALSTLLKRWVDASLLASSSIASTAMESVPWTPTANWVPLIDKDQGDMSTTDVHDIIKAFQEGCEDTDGDDLDTSPSPIVNPTQKSWTKGTVLGVGGCSSVYIGQDQTDGRLMAVKSVPMTGRTEEELQGKLNSLHREISMMEKLQHPNIVQYLGSEIETRLDPITSIGGDVQRTGYTASLYIFMEYIPGGSLTSLVRRLGRLTEQSAKTFTMQILQGIEYLHKKGIAHRDIKGGNVLVHVSDEQVCKVSDFGFASELADVRDFVGTPHFMAPEVVRKQPVTLASDIWSLGCTVYQMLTGQAPLQNLKPGEVLSRARTMKEGHAAPANVSVQCKDFLDQCFRVDPSQRPSASELLKHAWILSARASSPRPSTRGNLSGVSSTSGVSPSDLNSALLAAASEPPPSSAFFDSAEVDRQPPAPLGKASSGRNRKRPYGFSASATLPESAKFANSSTNISSTISPASLRTLPGEEDLTALAVQGLFADSVSQSPATHPSELQNRSEAPTAVTEGDETENSGDAQEDSSSSEESSPRSNASSGGVQVPRVSPSMHLGQPSPT